MKLTSTNQPYGQSAIQIIGRLILGVILFVAGIRHLSWSRVEFLAQVPNWVPLDADLVVILSGIVEIILGLALIIMAKQRILIGYAVALFFVLIFPGNISQYITQTDAFGLDTDRARFIRLLFQPLLVIWALWCTGAWTAWRNKTT